MSEKSERNLEVEIDEIKKQLEAIKTDDIKMMLEFIAQNSTSSAKKENKKIGHIEKMQNMHPLPEIRAILDRLENTCGENGETGTITYLGVFASGGRQSTWIKNEISTDVLLNLIETGMAGKVLNCIGNNDRLNILLAILRKPMTVAELVTHGGYSSTGQVYHHLKPLITADLITEDKNSAKGTYVVQPHKVQGIIMLLAGISDMVDETYSKGNWEAQEKQAQTEE